MKFKAPRFNGLQGREDSFVGFAKSVAIVAGTENRNKNLGKYCFKAEIWPFWREYLGLKSDHRWVKKSGKFLSNGGR